MACAEVHSGAAAGSVADRRSERGWLIVSPYSLLLARLFAQTEHSLYEPPAKKVNMDIVETLLSFSDATTLATLGAVCKVRVKTVET